MIFSVVVCTFNRVGLLGATIESLLNQEFPKDKFEIVVVDNNSSDSTSGLVESIAARSQIPVRYIFEATQGLSYARNAGIASSKGQFIAFTDDDIEAEPSWLSAIYRKFEAPEVYAVGGPLRPLWLGERPRWLSQHLLPCLTVNEFPLAKESGEFKSPYFPWGANMAFRKAAFDEFGTFLPDLGRIGHVLLSNEELELFHRIERNHKIIAFAEDAIVNHKIVTQRLQKRWFLKRHYWQGISDAIFDERSGTKGYSTLQSKYDSLLKKAADADSFTEFDLRCYQRIVVGYLYQKLKRSSGVGSGNFKMLKHLHFLVRETVETIINNRINYQKQISVHREAETTARDESVTLKKELETIKSSLSWKMTAPIRNAVPAVRAIRPNAVSLIKKLFIKEHYNPYKYISFVKDINVNFVDKVYPDCILKFSIVTTVFNEADNIADFIKSIEEQSALPEQLVIVDGGSSDSTVDIINSLSHASNLPITLILAGKVNIAKGRNIGVEAATNDIILFTDAGCLLDVNFARNLIGPFMEYEDVDLVGGIYHPLVASEYSRRHFIYNWENVDWKEFLPSARAIAVRKHLVQKIGGFPEFLTLTGEDTLFDIMYRRESRRWMFNKSAFVYWDAPSTRKRASTLAFNYGVGDGESGYGAIRFYGLKPGKVKSIVKSFDPIPTAALNGYLHGKKQRSQIEIEKRKIKGLVLILSGVPITDSGGGQRGAQIALEYIRKNYKVLYVNLYPSYEEEKKVYLDLDPSLLELYYISDFDVKQIIGTYSDVENVTVISEFPHPEFITIVDEAKIVHHNVCFVFDYIDNWHSSLGWVWYSREKEDILINKADVLIASARNLQTDLQARTSKTVLFVPNAVNTFLFSPDRIYARPADFDFTTQPVIMYVGAMWGEWFDWELVQFCAKSLSDCTFAFIGTCPQEIRDMYATQSNMIFLGLKQQSDLPSYLAHSQACIIPFKRDNITKYVNPLKVYEYLAMIKPVVTTEMEELVGIPGVILSDSKKSFVESVRKAIKAPINSTEIRSFVDANSWTRRVEAINDAISVWLDAGAPRKQ